MIANKMIRIMLFKINLNNNTNVHFVVSYVNPNILGYFLEVILVSDLKSLLYRNTDGSQIIGSNLSY